MKSLVDVLLPPQCPGCGALVDAEPQFCEECEALVEAIPSAACVQCGEPGRYDGACPTCRSAPPPFVRAYAPFEHDGAIARAVHRFKYEDHPELARALATILAWRSEAFLADAPRDIVPVPLHDERYRTRKYDQAALLGVELARLTRRTLVDDVLWRSRATQRQVGLSEQARHQNVSGAFSTRRRLDGHSVLLLDDVYTTGSTARAAAQALLAAGATGVWVLTFARANRASGTSG